MSEYELQRKEAIGLSETLRVIEATRALLPHAKPEIIDLSDMFDDEEAVSVVLGARSNFRLGQTDISIEETDSSGVPEITVTVKVTDAVGDFAKKTINIYTVDLNDLTTDFASLESTFDPSVPARSLQQEDVPSLVEEVSIMMQVDEIAGDNILTQERFSTLMRLLNECDADNMIDFSAE